MNNIRPLHFEVVEAWDKKLKKNESRYLSKDDDFIAIKKVFTGTEFYKIFCSTKGKRFNFLIKLWSQLNKGSGA
jgi:hypothetical protein